MGKYINFWTTKLAGGGYTMIITAIGNALPWLKIYPHIRIIASIILFFGGIILLVIAYINTNKKNKEITIRNINYLLSNGKIEIHLSALAVKFLITKAIDDAKISHSLLDRYARNYICEPLIIGYAKRCYILIYVGRNSNKEIYDKLLKNANALLRIFDCIQTNIKITPETIEYTENQIREAINIVKDNLIQEGFLKE
jgi:hypothetical protein